MQGRQVGRQGGKPRAVLAGNGRVFACLLQAGRGMAGRHSWGPAAAAVEGQARGGKCSPQLTTRLLIARAAAWRALLLGLCSSRDSAWIAPTFASCSLQRAGVERQAREEDSDSQSGVFRSAARTKEYAHVAVAAAASAGIAPHAAVACQVAESGGDSGAQRRLPAGLQHLQQLGDGA